MAASFEAMENHPMLPDAHSTCLDAKGVITHRRPCSQKIMASDQGTIGWAAKKEWGIAVISDVD
jgi:hypothetical protein